MAGKITYDLTPYLDARSTPSVQAGPNRRRVQASEPREYRSAGAAPRRVAVVTCICGADASLQMPRHPLANADYICFSDRPRCDGGLFRIRPIDFFHVDPIRSVQFVKTHLHLYLDACDAAIWLDGSLIVTGDLQPYLDAFLSSAKPLGAIGRTLWRSVQQEAEVGAAEAIDASMAPSRGGGLHRSDRAELGFFICRPGDRRFKAFCDLWWSGIDRRKVGKPAGIANAVGKANLKLVPLAKKVDSIGDVFAFASPDRYEPNSSGRPSDLGAVRDPYEAAPYSALKRERLAVQRGRRVDVVVCVHDALDDVKRCLSSLVPTLAAGHRIILVDDGSSPPTEAWLSSFAAGDRRTLLVRNPERRAYTKAANIGLRASDAEFAILLNSDTIVTPDWIEKLCDAAFANLEVGIVGPLSNAANFQSIPKHIGSRQQTAVNPIPSHISIESLNRRCEEWTAGSFLPRVPLVHGFCLGIRREVIERIGLFDEEAFPRGYGEESDYCLRAGDAGFGLLVATHTYVYHAKSKSYADVERIALTKAAGVALRSKHGTSRVNRAVLSVVKNPVLQVFRARARAYYRQAAPMREPLAAPCPAGSPFSKQ